MNINSEAYSIRSPHGSVIQVPFLDTREYPSPSDYDGVKNYFADEGYVVLRGIIPPAICDAAIQRFTTEVIPYPGHIYRQATANPEKHIFTEAGYMLNSILNIQDLPRARFPGFREVGLDIISDQRLGDTLFAIFGERGKLVQSMFFDGNPSTWAHQDTYYLDGEVLGSMVGAWIAVEDIHPGAGRFYIYPKSHLIDLPKNGKDFDVAFNHKKYKEYVLDIIRENGLECRAPALKKGDVLLWGAKTIHGSLETLTPEYSRKSFTSHFIPQSSKFLQFQTIEKKLKIQEINGTEMHCPKDLNRLENRAILHVETSFPQAYQLLKKLAIKFLVG